MENPERIKIQIYKTKENPPILEKVSKSMGRLNLLENFDFIECGVSESDKMVLLSRPQIAWLDNKKSGQGEIPYKKVPDSEQGIRAHTRPGMEIRVTYEIMR